MQEDWPFGNIPPSSHISKYKYLTVFYESNINAKVQTVIMFLFQVKIKYTAENWPI